MGRFPKVVPVIDKTRAPFCPPNVLIQMAGMAKTVKIIKSQMRAFSNLKKDVMKEPKGKKDETTPSQHGSQFLFQQLFLQNLPTFELYGRPSPAREGMCATR